MASVQYDAATRLYPGTPKPAVNELDLSIADGELLVLVGPSGSGKSTALRMLAGLEPLDAGRVLIGGKDVSTVRPRDRDIAMVFQNYALYPQLDVAANMGFALKQQGVSKEERKRRVHDVAKLLDLEPYLDRKPRNLSGGQRQRVAMGRAIVRHPQVFLMDEPLSNLDAKLRVQTRTELVELQQRLAVTTVYVAGFIGSPAMNTLPVSMNGGLQIAGADIPFAADTTFEPATIGFRPETVLVGADGPIAGRIRVVEDLGSEVFVHLFIDHQNTEYRIVSKVEAPFAGVSDDNVRLSLRGTIHVFDDAEVKRATVTL